MRLEDNYYTHLELLGEDPGSSDVEDKVYSEADVERISDLFDEYYSTYSDEYDSIDTAYADFLTAYANVHDELVEIDSYADKKDQLSISFEPEEENQVSKKTKANKNSKALVNIKNKNLSNAVIAGSGAVAGYGISKLANKKLVRKKQEIEDRMSKGLASSKEIEQLEKIKAKIKRNKVIGTISGSAATLGAAQYYKKRKNKN